MQQVRLMRSNSDKMIAGVCGGIAGYLGVDSIFVRLAFLVLFFASGIGLLIYLILMFIMPSETRRRSESVKILQENLDEYGHDINSNVRKIRAHPQGPAIAAGLLIILGFYLLLGNFGWLAWIGSGIFWSIILVGLGIYLMVRSKRERM